MNTDYRVRVSDEIEDPDWDAFVSRVPGGHYSQISLWAKVKALLGWQVARIVVRHHGNIVGGVQILMRSMSPVGVVGYVTKGPVLTSDDSTLAELVINKLQRVSKAYHIRYLALQPSNNGEALARQLPRWGFQKSLLSLTPPATVLIDLTQDLDRILSKMKKRTRYNVRLSQRKGIIVREGTAPDLGTFYRLLLAVGERRQDFITYPQDYFSKIWQVFGAHGYLKLFLSEYHGEPVSGQLIIAFGDTVASWRSGWSGHHGSRKPNEALRWTVLQWAKSQGYHYYDLGGIHVEAARAIMDGEQFPDGLERTVTSFKLGYGGEVVLRPESYSYVYNPFLRWTYGKVVPMIEKWPVLWHTIDRLIRR